MKRLYKWWWWWWKLRDQPRRRALTWSRLRTIGHLPLMKATIFVPLIGYLIIFNETVAKYLQLVWEKDAAPLSTNLLLVYFGLVFLSLASIVYKFRCDPRVDQYGSPEAYIGGDGPNISAVTLGAFENEVIGAGYDLDAWQEDGISPVGTLDRKKDILWCVYNKWDTAFPIARLITTVFYVVGFLFLLIPSALVFWKVAGILLYRIS